MTKTTDPAVRPTFFASALKLRAWLEKNHDKKQELWVGFHKKHSGKPSISWPEPVDEAVCFGWIDGVRKSIDGASYMIRFTPRTPGSTWSADRGLGLGSDDRAAHAQDGREGPAAVGA